MRLGFTRSSGLGSIGSGPRRSPRLPGVTTRDRDFFERQYTGIEKNMLLHGWQVTGVMPTASDPPGAIPFFYTIGLTSHRLPELIMSWPGRPETATQLLNGAGRIQVDEGPIEPGPLDNAANVTFKVVEVDAVKADIQQAWNFYGDPHRRRTNKIKLLQLVWPDSTDRFPGQPGYNMKEFPQELFAPLNP